MRTIQLPFFVMLLIVFSCTNKNNKQSETSKTDKSNLKTVELTIEEKKSLIQDSLLKVIKWSNDSSLISYYVSKGADVNKRDENGIYPLYWAQYYSYEKNVEKLTNLGAIDFNGQVEKFLLYCKNGNKDSIEFLINNGFDINSYKVYYEESNEGGGCGCACKETGLFYAAKSQNIELVNFLINEGAKVDLEEGALQPLEPAIQKRNYELAKLLISKGSSKNVSLCYWDNSIYGPSYYNALIFADSLLINFLIENNFPYPEKMWDWSYGPLSSAVKRNDYYIVENLLKISKNIKEINTSVNFSKSEKILKLLLSNGANINSTYSWAGEGNSGSVISPLYSAVETEDTNYVRFLLKKGADPNILDSQYNGKDHIRTSYFMVGAPLIKAASLGNIEIAEILINAGANINFSTKKGYNIETKQNKYGEYAEMWETPLTIAVRNNDFSMVSLLINHNADVIVHGDTIANYKYEDIIKDEIKAILK